MTEKSTKDGIKPVIITADSRESRSGIALKLQGLPGVSLEQAELTSGDYLIGAGVAVERKAATDFVISLMEGRLFDQLARMAIEHERAIILVEGNIYETRSAISPEALDGYPKPPTSFTAWRSISSTDSDTKLRSGQPSRRVRQRRSTSWKGCPV